MDELQKLKDDLNGIISGFHDRLTAIETVALSPAATVDGTTAVTLHDRLANVEETLHQIVDRGYSQLLSFISPARAAAAAATADIATKQ